MHSTIKCLDKGFVRLVDSMGNDNAIVQKARVSYGEGTKQVSEDEGLIRYLLRNKHTSPFEGVIFKFHVKAPIFVFRQWHRHRMWSYNEMSGRYSEMPDEFYVPDVDKITTQNPDNKQGGTNDLIINPEISREMFEYDQENVRAHYEGNLKTGMRKELARINLPLSQYSEMYATVDLHNLLHFLKLRQDSHAQYEIRVYADAILELIRPIVPITVKAYEDYILGSITLSKIEQKVLADILEVFWIYHDTNDSSYEEELVKLVKSNISNKREQSELLAKLKF